MILNDKEIIALCEKGMISPFNQSQITESKGIKTISSGLSSFGYDISLSSDVRIFHNRDKYLDSYIIDPKNFNTPFTEAKIIEDETGVYFLLPRHSFALGCSNEYFKIPDDIMCLCTCKSTYARCGLNINNTTFEPEFEGDITLELTNCTDFPIKIYIFEGIAQVLFIKGNRPNVTYADRKGKYQHQLGVQGALV